MSTVRLRVGGSAVARSAHPGTVYANPVRLSVRSGACYSYVRVRLGSELRPGVTIISATLQLTQDSDYTETMQAQRIAETWRLRTICWNNQPSVTGPVITGSKNGRVLSFDVTADVQAMVDGDEIKQGWRITTTDAVTSREMWGYGADSGDPLLVVVYAYAPAAPTDLRPSSGAVSVTKPVLSWTADEHAAVQVQIDPTGAFTAPTFDSGTVATAANSYDLSSSSYGGITAGSTQWRVRVQNSQGQWSAWSSAATFPYASKPSATIPQPGAEVWEVTPPMKLDVIGLTRARFVVADTANPGTVVYDSGEFPTTDGTHTPTKPAFTVDGHTYLVTAYGWDNVVRSATPGDPPYVKATTTTTLELDAGTSGVDWTSATQVGSAPAVRVSVSRAVMPDAFALIRDGRRLVSDLDPNDLLVPGTTIYAYTDWACPPQEPHAYRLAPIVNGKTAADGFGQHDTVVPVVNAQWLLDPATGDAVPIFGSDDGSWTIVEDVAIDRVPNADGSTNVIRRRYSRGRPEGTVVGQLLAVSGYEDYDPAASAALLDQWAESDPAYEYRLVRGNENIPVTIGDMIVGPTRLSKPEDVVRQVSFSFWGA